MAENMVITAADVGTMPAAFLTNAPTNGGVTMVEQSFHFKKEKVRDPATGNIVGENPRLPTVKLALPIPTAKKLADILTSTNEKDKKAADLIMAGVNDIVYAQARMQINDFRGNDTNRGKPITASILNYDKLDWDAIANMPKSERGSSVPSDEDMQEFFDMYVEIMPEALQKDVAKIQNHVVLFKDGFRKQRAQKNFLQVFKDALAVFANSATEEQMESVGTVWEYYDNRLERMLKAEEQITMDMI